MLLLRPASRLFIAALALLAQGLGARADTPLHSLWELHGKHNTVYLLGSIHVLRASDYPLAPAVLEAYRTSKSLYMEINLDEVDQNQLQTEMLAGATLPPGKSLRDIMGQSRYTHAASLAGEIGFDLSTFDAFEPWFAAEAITQLQLAQLGFAAQSGVEMYFLDRARADGKSIAGLETLHDQLALFENMPIDTQAQYLVTSLEEARDLPREVDDMVHAWQRGDAAWFDHEITTDVGRDPALYQSLLVNRNRKWIARIEALLDDDKNVLVIVGTAHIVGRDGLIELLKKDGVAAIQR